MLILMLLNCTTTELKNDPNKIVYVFLCEEITAVAEATLTKLFVKKKN